jgi:hypothetical protein
MGKNFRPEFFVASSKVSGKSAVSPCGFPSRFETTPEGIEGSYSYHSLGFAATLQLRVQKFSFELGSYSKHSRSETCHLAADY